MGSFRRPRKHPSVTGFGPTGSVRRRFSNLGPVPSRSRSRSRTQTGSRPSRGGAFYSKYMSLGEYDFGLPLGAHFPQGTEPNRGCLSDLMSIAGRDRRPKSRRNPGSAIEVLSRCRSWGLGGAVGLAHSRGAAACSLVLDLTEFVVSGARARWTMLRGRWRRRLLRALGA